jgi:uncharacterized membrane protein required for colicin V production
MTTIDITILVLLGAFAVTGLWFGVIHMFGTLIGLAVGAILAGRLYDGAGAILAPWIGGNLRFASTFMFFTLFVLTNRAIGLLVMIVNKIFNFIAVVPFMKTFNRLLGAGLGVIEGIIVLGLVVYLAVRMPFSPLFAEALKASTLIAPLDVVGSLFAPLLPMALRAVKSVL